MLVIFLLFIMSLMPSGGARATGIHQMEEMGETSYARIVLRNKTVVVLWYDDTSASAPEDLEAWDAVYRRFGDYFTFATVKKSRFPDYLSHLGIEEIGPKSHAFIVHNVSKFHASEGLHGETVNYPLSGVVTVEALMRLLEAAETAASTHKEKADVFLGGQPVLSDPLDSSDGFMKAVASTVEGMVFDATKRMTLVMYAPEEGCVKCAAATLMIRKLRDRMTSSMRDSISFVKFDPTRNAYPSGGHINPMFIFPEFVIRNGTPKDDTKFVFISLDPRRGIELVEDFMKAFILLEHDEDAMDTGQHPYNLPDRFVVFLFVVFLLFLYISS